MEYKLQRFFQISVHPLILEFHYTSGAGKGSLLE